MHPLQNLFRIALATTASILMFAPVGAQTIPSFSGADGAGAIATGGRGGVIYHVTRLDGNEINSSIGTRGSVVGTLAYGLSDNNFTNPDGSITPRTIVFDVGGTFWLSQRGLNTGWDSQTPLSAGTTFKESSITIAGQTAPGGVTIMGGGVKLNGNNIIMRNVTIAPGYGTRGVGADSMPDSFVYDGIHLQGQRHMVDHVSVFFATDEAISSNENARNSTVQYSNISQGQNYPQLDAEGGGYTGHALGMLHQPGNQAPMSFNYNLYAHQKGRLPRVGTETPANWNTAVDGPFVGAYNEFRGNVFYNWLGTAGSGASGQQSNTNFIGNLFLAGQGGDNPTGSVDSSGIPTLTNASGGTGIFSGGSTSATRIFHSGNVRDTDKDGTAEFTTAITNTNFSSSTFVASRYNVRFLGATLSAQDSFKHVMNYVGANWWNRSAIDQRIINETQTGTGKIIAWADPTHGTEWNSLLALRPSTYAGGIGGTGVYARDANFDTDRDGMADAWEVKYGLNPNVADNNGDYDNDGYTNVEEYLNELAEWPSPVPLVFNGATNNRYAQITNWQTTWQPSKYDTAVINSGTAVMDAIGQHADVIQVGGGAGLTASFNITNGWIEVQDGIDIGTANAGTGLVTQTGGTVRVGQSIVVGAVAGSNGTYRLEGGELYVPVIEKGSGNGTFQMTGGTLHAGLLNLSLVNNGGTIAPGMSIGHTEIIGDLSLVSGAVEIEVNGLSADTIGITGALALGGDLHIVGYEGYVPQAGDFWTVAIADGGISGAFASVTPGFQTQISGNSLIVTMVSAVPEPSSTLLLGATCAIAFARRKRT